MHVRTCLARLFAIRYEIRSDARPNAGSNLHRPASCCKALGVYVTRCTKRKSPLLVLEQRDLRSGETQPDLLGIAKIRDWEKEKKKWDSSICRSSELNSHRARFHVGFSRVIVFRHLLSAKDGYVVSRDAVEVLFRRIVQKKK